MSYISKLSDYYYVHLDIKHDIPEKKKTHIIILDNQNIKKEISSIINTYPTLLIKYMKHTNLDKIFLITTFPKIKVTEINNNNIFTVFRKIIFNNNSSEIIDDIYVEFLNKCKELLDPNLQNEIMIFTNFNYMVSLKIKNILASIVDNENNYITLVSNNNIIESPRVTIFLTSELGDLTDGEVYENLIKTGIILQEQLNDKIVNIDLKSIPLYATNNKQFKINIDDFDTFLIDNEISDILVDDNTIILDKKDPSNNHILNVIEHLIEMINNDDIHDKNIYIFIKTKLLEIMNCNNNEDKNKAILIYNKTRQIFNKILIGELNKTLLNDDNNKILIEYTKNTYMTKTKNISHTNIFNNIDKINNSNTNVNHNLNKFIAEYEDSENKLFNDSCEFFNSSITLSNWFEELQNNSGIGLLLKINSKCSKSGYFSHIIINNVTNTFFPIVDYICTIKEYFDKNTDMKFGDLNKANIISGAAIGDANSIIPLYINKNHWKCISQYINPLLGIIVKHNPFSYNNTTKSVLFDIFADMTTKLFNSSKQYYNQQYLKIYIAYLRTCAEICFENKYNHGIKKMISSYITDPLFRISKDKSMIYKICSQTLVTGYILNSDELKVIIPYFIEELIRLTVKFNKYEDSYINYFNELSDSDKEYENNSLITAIYEKLQYDLAFLISYYKMNYVMDMIIKHHGSYNKFIKSLDENYGLIDDEITLKILNSININNEHSSFEDVYNTIGLQYNKYNILMYIFQGIHHKINKVRIDNIKNHTYIDSQKIEVSADTLNEHIFNKIEKSII